jgi:hypothetical protein
MFFNQLYRNWRPFFWIVVVWVGAQFFFMFKGIENAPFFIYSMFSTPHPERAAYPVVFIRSENGYIDPFQFSNRQAELLLNNVPFYARMRQNGYTDDINVTIEKRFAARVSPETLQALYTRLSNDSTRVQAFPGWWGRYFGSIAPKGIGQVSLVESSVRFPPSNFEKSPDDSLIFTFKPGGR